MNRARLFAAVVVAAVASTGTARAQSFSYEPAGTLVSGSGKGRVDEKVYAPNIRFPIESGPAFANSQVWGRGGSKGGGGGQCDKENFSYPWHDNYCETRDWDMPLCPSGQGHQGQDIRAADCTKMKHRVVAVTDGTITNIGSYSVYLTAADGTRFDYLHMGGVAVKVGQKVKRGDFVGLVSNEFGGEATTVHLHFNIRQNVQGVGAVYVPTYHSLIQAYEVLLGIRSAPGEDAGVDAALPTPEPPPPSAAPPPASEPPPPPADEESTGCALSPAKHGASASSLLFLVLGALLLRRANVARKRQL